MSGVRPGRVGQYRSMFTTRPDLRGTFGMVASTHWLATAVGMRCSRPAATRSTRRSAAGVHAARRRAAPQRAGRRHDPIIGHRAPSRADTFVVCGQGTAPARATIELPRPGPRPRPGHGPPRRGRTRRVRRLARSCSRATARSRWPTCSRWRSATPATATRSPCGADRDDRRGRRAVRRALAHVGRGLPPHGEVPAPGRAVRQPRHWPTRSSAWLARGEHAGAQIESARRAFYEGFVAEAVDAFCRPCPCTTRPAAAHRPAACRRTKT